MAIALVLAMAVAASEPAPGTGSILNPSWEKNPNARHMENAIQSLPRWVLAQGIRGYAVISCAVLEDGRLDACKVTEEAPQNAGFGAAALGLAKRFQMTPTLSDGRSVGGGAVRIPIGFGMKPPGRGLSQPR